MNVFDLKAHRPNCKARKPRSVPKSSALTLTDDVDHTAPRKVHKHADHYLLLDVSGSMAGSRLMGAKSALIDVVQQLPSKDRMAIVTFDTHAFFKLQPRPVGQIRRKKELPGILGGIFAQGGTALYDAIYLAVSQIRDKDVSTALTVLTDGEDNSSSHTLQEVLDLVAQYPKIRLDIVHIGDRPIPAYVDIAQVRGSYSMITEVEIIIKIKTTMLKPLAF
jgi:uncharacterized protein with von Willebrand factor type A (vWA) domain